ncbi:hypothetical protein MOO46_07355 (plasmid) [Apilactobacillus apisilvae]|uniref:Uncharacterized protein n=1 Tax=Apilactobacillus apisilvae TaxID=2923364 RepID=A0ABY4PKD8_9LACO|nr:hypothetical protein [Apilactobacillus apisilvae]UQS85801.1 hypothetical protein MOO46_07355 [Apilactobacillus apisilvae]
MNYLDLDTIKTIVWIVLAVVGSTYTYIYRKVAIHRHKQDEINNAKNDKLAQERANKQAELDEQKARDDFDNNMNTALEVAKNKVVPLAVNDTLGNADKRKLAVQRINTGLNKLGIDLPEPVISEASERAYQWYKASGGDIHKLNTSDGNNNQPSDKQTVKVEMPNNQENNGNQSQPNNPYEKRDVTNE